MCAVLLPPGVNPIAVNKYIDINTNNHPKNKTRDQITLYQKTTKTTIESTTLTLTLDFKMKMALQEEPKHVAAINDLI